MIKIRSSPPEWLDLHGRLGDFTGSHGSGEGVTVYSFDGPAVLCAVARVRKCLRDEGLTIILQGDHYFLWGNQFESHQVVFNQSSAM